MYWEHNHVQSVHFGSQHWPKWTMYYHAKKVCCPPTLSNCLLLAPFLFSALPRVWSFYMDVAQYDSVGLSWVKSSERHNSAGNKQLHILWSLLQLWADHRRCLVPKKHLVCLPLCRAPPTFNTSSKAFSITRRALLTESKSVPSCLPAIAVSLAVLCTILSPSRLGKPFVFSFRCCDKS